MATTDPDSTPGPRSALHDFLYRRHEHGDSEDLEEAARGWMDAVHMFATEALAAGVSATEVLPAVVQMLEGWMLARDAASLGTTWIALDATVTVLERRLAEVRAERDQLRYLNARLLARRSSHKRRKHQGHGKNKS